MKKLSIILAIFLVVSVGCWDHEDLVVYESIGQITGPDYGMCMCCGGWMITIDGADSLSQYRFGELPESATIDLEHADFPIPVKFNWTEDFDCGGIEWIDLVEIERID